MKTIFDQVTREELISRVNSLTGSNTGQWGKMNVYQMTKHCTLWNDWMLGVGRHHYRQEWLGRIFGKLALKGLVKDESLMKKNMPAGPFAIKEKEGDVEQQKRKWAEQITAYGSYSNPTFIHSFFGKMTVEEIGIFVYKHLDHHLRQFGV